MVKATVDEVNNNINWWRRDGGGGVGGWRGGGRMKRWKDGGMEGWKSGRMEEEMVMEWLWGSGDGVVVETWW